MELEIILTFVIIIAAIIGLLLMSRGLVRFIRPNQKLTREFFEQLDKKFELNLVKDKDDIVVLADSFKRAHFASYELNTLLEDYLRYLITMASNSEPETKGRAAVGEEKHALLTGVVLKCPAVLAISLLIDSVDFAQQILLPIQIVQSERQSQHFAHRN